MTLMLLIALMPRSLLLMPLSYVLSVGNKYTFGRDSIGMVSMHIAFFKD